MTPVILYAAALKDSAAELLAPAGFLAGLKGCSRDSARAFLRAQPGFLGRNLTLEAAKELQAAALAAGFEAVLAREEEIPSLPPALKVSKIEIKDGGFTAEAGGALQFVSFYAVDLLTAAAFDAPAPPASLDALKPGIFSKLMHLAGVPPYEPAMEGGARETYFRADLIAEAGKLRLLLEPENMDFSPLGPGRSHSSLANFRELLRLLSGACHRGVNNAFLPAFLANMPLTQLKLSGPEACEAELTRLLLISTLNK